MIKEAIGVGETLEEATEMAKAELNASFDDDVQFEVLANPKKKTLGLFGGSKAKVRVYIEVPDPAPRKQRSQKAKNENRKQENRPAKAATQKTAEKKTEKQVAALADAIPAEQVDAASPAGRAVAYLKPVLKGLGIDDVKIFVAVGENSARITLEGENLGIVIGRRGETLDSLQYLTSLAANSGNGYYRISLNTGNYREKREEALRTLSRRIANQVMRTGHSRTLEPMNPYERRIIHTAIQGIDGVESSSIGEGNSRRVVISPVGGNRRYDSRPSRGRGQRSPRPITAAPDREPKKDAAELPLYGKID